MVEQVAPDPQGLADRAARPCGEGRDVALFAWGEPGRPGRWSDGGGLGGGQTGGDRRPMGRAGAGEHEVALDAVSHDEAGIGGQRGGVADGMR